MRMILIILLGLIASCGQPQQANGNKVLHDIASYLPQGRHEVEIIEFTESRIAKELGQRFYEAIQKNWDWFVEEQRKAKALDQLIPYDKRMGLTKEEYSEYLESLENAVGREYAKKGSEIITINNIDNKITFQSKGQLEILNTITIDLSNLTVTVGNYRLNQVDTLNVADDKNVFKSSWKGYCWYIDNNDTAADNAISGERPFAVTIGKLAKNKKTYVRVHIVDVSNERPINSQIQFVL